MKTTIAIYVNYLNEKNTCGNFLILSVNIHITYKFFKKKIIVNKFVGQHKKSYKMIIHIKDLKKINQTTIVNIYVFKINVHTMQTIKHSRFVT